jgi:dynein heavy chain
LLDNLELTVASFDQNKRLDKYADIAIEVDRVDERVADCLENARTFNSREYLVGKETTDYSRLQKLAKDFLPYSNLWKTTRTWYDSHKGWMNDPWEELDAIKLEETFENCLKVINQVVRTFRDKD